LKRSLLAARAAVSWLVLLACLSTLALVDAAPAGAATLKTYTASTSANVRSGASTSKTILAQLQAGDSVIAAGAVSGDWLPIKYDNATAYVWAEYLDPNTNPAAVVLAGPTGRKTATKNINVRAEASFGAAITAVLTKGTALKVTGLTSGDFVQVSVDGKIQWAHAKFLSTATDTTPDTVAAYTTTAKLALRTTASVAATNQGTIKAGSTVRTTGTHTGSYSQVVYSGKVGWVITGFLKAVDGTPDDLVLPLTKGTRYTLAADVVLRASAASDGAKVGTIAQDSTTLRITGTTKGAFTEVIWNGGTAWVATTDVGTTKPTIDLGSSSLNKLEPYGKAAVLEVRANFPEIKTIYGWRSSSAYSSDHPNGRATDNMIPNYKSNKALGDRVAQYFIDNGARLHVTYIIWRQRTYRITRGYWVKMADRGSDTQNHMDHVHVSFEPS
jgi:uncharacterized protein YgiM (DUF1202 family)